MRSNLTGGSMWTKLSSRVAKDVAPAEEMKQRISEALVGGFKALKKAKRDP